MTLAEENMEHRLETIAIYCSNKCLLQSIVFVRNPPGASKLLLQVKSLFFSSDRRSPVAEYN